MEQTIYSKYSNERARQFCIRTDIVLDDTGEKKVYKHALTPEGDAHINQIASSYQKLEKAYEESGIRFCPCEVVCRQEDEACRARVGFPFLRGETLHELIGRAVSENNTEEMTRILQEYIRRMRKSGGETDFVWTGQFEEVFGVGEEVFTEDEQLSRFASAEISDVDMIFSNIFVEETAWQVIDYEWTFDFPIPKDFLIYRALYFAYYQILYRSSFNLSDLLAMADITEKQADLFQKMEEHFQLYMGKGTLPVRNMQRVMGTKIVGLSELISTGTAKHIGGDAGVAESEWMKVRRIRYHIDRSEQQDGAMVCSGWAVASTWDGRMLPVNIKLLDESGRELQAEITRRERVDVASALKVRRVTNATWGFDCVWIIAEKQKYKIHFSLGNKECICSL